MRTSWAHTTLGAKKNSRTIQQRPGEKFHQGFLFAKQFFVEL